MKPTPLILTVCALLFQVGIVVAAAKPNIVIILVDDMGYGDPGCYNTKSKIILKAINFFD